MNHKSLEKGSYPEGIISRIFFLLTVRPINRGKLTNKGAYLTIILFAEDEGNIAECEYWDYSTIFTEPEDNNYCFSIIAPEGDCQSNLILFHFIHFVFKKLRNHAVAILKISASVL